MEVRTPNWRKVAMPAGFALVCTILTLLVFWQFGGNVPLSPHGYRVTVALDQASNLVPGSDVDIAGVQVGEVVRIDRKGNGAVATLEMTARYAPLRAGVRAIPRTKTLLGEGYVELAPGPRTAPMLPDGGEIPRRHVAQAQQLDQALEAFTPETRKRIRQMFAGMSRAFDGRGEDLNGSLANMSSVSDDMAEVFHTLDGQRKDLGGLVASSGEVLNALGQRQGALRAAVTSSRDVFDVTARRDRELAATVRAMPAFLRQLRSTSQTVEESSPDLNRAVAALLPSAPLLPPVLEQINSEGPNFRAVFDRLPALIAAGNRGLPTVAPIARAAKGGFKEFYPAARELIPVMQLIAANPDAPASPFGMVANIFGLFVGPGGRLAGAASGLPTVWNESVAGWKHRLPTNVQNPYLKPRGLLDIAKLGYIKAFDCRNVNNPLVIPPTGTGAPPCLLQGPWEFNGKSAFYPRLELAPK